MSAVEQIQKQYACASAVNNREMKLESFGFFLKDYVIQGAEIQLDQNNPRRFTITEGIVSFADGLWRVYADTVTLPRKAATYFVAFTLKAGYVVNDEYPQDEYLPLWQINTDATGNITGAVDLRGDMGFVRFRDEIQGIITDHLVVDEEHITPGAVGTTRLQDQAVTAEKIADGAVREFHMAENSVTSSAIQGQAVKTEHLANKSVTESKIKGPISEAKLKLNTPTSVLDSRLADVEYEVNFLSQRISNIVTTPAGGVSEQEIFDARMGKASLGEKVAEIDAKLADHAISPENFAGTDYEKLQSAIDYAYDTGAAVRLTKMYDITGHTIILKKAGEHPREGLYIFGDGGGIIKNDAGYVFDTLPEYDDVGDLFLTRIKFQSMEGAETVIFNAEKIIRIVSMMNYYKDVDSIIHATDTYIQSIRFIGDYIVGGEGAAFYFRSAYDLTIEDCLIEWREHAIMTTGPGTNVSHNIRIVNNVIEGLTGTAVKLSMTNSLIISGNYFEANEGDYIDLSTASSKGYLVQSNYFHLGDGESDEKVCIKWPICHNHSHTSISNRTNKGYLHGIPDNLTFVVSTGDINESGDDKLATGSVDSLIRQDVRLTAENGIIKRYFGAIKTIYKQQTVNFSNLDEIKTFTFDMGEQLKVEDLVTAEAVGDTTHILNCYYDGTTNTVKVIAQNTYNGPTAPVIRVKVLRHTTISYFG